MLQLRFRIISTHDDDEEGGSLSVSFCVTKDVLFSNDTRVLPLIPRGSLTFDSESAKVLYPRHANLDTK